MIVQRLLLAAALLAAPFLALAQAPTARLMELADNPVLDASGAKLADVYDVVIDTTEGRAAYLVVTVGMRLVPLPLPSPSVSLTPDRVTLAMPRAGLDAIGTLDLAALGANFRRGRDVLGTKLRDSQGTEIGEVKDLMVTLADGRIASVVVEFDPKMWDKPGWVALPRESVKHDGTGYIATFKLDDMRPASQARAEQARADAARAAAATLDRDERLSQLLTYRVVDAQGKALGQVSDLVFEPASGKLARVIVTQAGGSLAALAAPVLGATRSGNDIVLGSATLAPAPALSGAERRVSEYMKRSLVDYRGKEVGKLREVVVNLAKGKVRYAAAEFDPTWVAAGNVVTIRMPKDDTMKVELNALMGAMIFPGNAWPDVNGAQFVTNIDAYLSKQ